MITDNRKHNKNRIARAKAAAEAAAASEAGSSQAGPSVRDRSNTRSPMLAALTPRRLAQRTASVTALARTLRCAPKTLKELVDEAAEDHPSQTLSRIDAMLAPPDPNKPESTRRKKESDAAHAAAPLAPARRPLAPPPAPPATARAPGGLRTRPWPRSPPLSPGTT